MNHPFWNLSNRDAHLLHEGEGDKGGGGGQGNADPGKKAGGDSDPKSFTEDQVAKIVGERLTQFAKSHGIDGIDADRKELDELRTAARNRTAADAADKGKFDESLKLLQDNHKIELAKQTGRAESADKRFESLAIDQALLTVVSAKAIRPENVVTILRPKIKLDAEGKPLFEDGKSIADGVEEYFKQNPHDVRADVRGGAGTPPKGGGNKDVKYATWADVPPEDKGKQTAEDIVRLNAAESGASPFAQHAAKLKEAGSGK